MTQTKALLVSEGREILRWIYTGIIALIRLPYRVKMSGAFLERCQQEQISKTVQSIRIFISLASQGWRIPFSTEFCKIPLEKPFKSPNRKLITSAV